MQDFLNLSFRALLHDNKDVPEIINQVYNVRPERYPPIFCEVGPHILYEFTDVSVQIGPVKLLGDDSSYITQSLVEEWLTKQIIHIFVVGDTLSIEKKLN